MNENEEFDLKQYLQVLRRRKWLILTSVAVCMSLAGLLSLAQPKIYEASSRVVISAQQDVAGSGNALSAPNQLQSQMNTEVQVVKSPEVEKLAEAALGDRAAQVKSISASGVGNTRVLTINATSESPQVAQEAANAYSDAYLKVGEQADLNRVLSIGKSVQAKQQQLQDQISQLQLQLGKGAPNANDLRSQINLLQGQVSQLQTQFNATQANAFVRENTAQPLSSAQLPADPISPKSARNTALGFVFGLLFGLGIALLLDRLDDRVRSTDDLERWIPDIPQLGMIPRVPGWSNEKEAKTVTLLDSHSPAAEAYRALRTNLEFVALDRKLQVIQVVSAIAGEGKSTTAANLAVSMAWSGKRVVLVAADLRQPRVHEFFGLRNDIGLTSMMLSDVSLQDSLQELPVSEGDAYLLATGPLPPNPTELLANNRLTEVFKELRDFADVIVIDSPPMLPVADSLVLSRQCDGVLLAARAGKVRRKELTHAIEQVQNARAGLLGIVLNGVGEQGQYSYGDKYYHAPETPQLVDVTSTDAAKVGS